MRCRLSRCIFALLSVLFWLPAAHAQLEDELLDPDSAFAISAEAVDAGIQVTWDVAEGYYLYQDRIRFSTSTPGLSLGEPVFPAGKVKDDEFFGRVTIHRGRMVVLVPVERRSEVLDLGITAVSQGCADVGVCYPPHTQNLRVTLASASLDAPAPIPALADKPAPLAALGALGQSLGLGAATEDELLPADEAFQFDAELRGNTLLARWVIAEGYYLYRDKIRLSLRDADGVRLGPPALPTGEVKDDEFFGRIEIYHGVLEVPVPVLRDGPASGPVTLEAGYQGCAEAGVCYPPVKKASCYSGA